MQEEILNQILSELKDLKTDVSYIKSDVSTLKVDVSDLKTDVSELKSDVSELRAGQQRIETKLDAAYEKIVENSEEITDIKNKLNQHSHSIGAVKYKS